MFTKNLFEVRQPNFDPDEKSVVFISYRRTICDKYEARECARILETIDGLSYWLDEDDKCMQRAQNQNNDVQTALCIEQGLDVSSALLGIIGPGTFTSPWIPYEIGGARGRQRYAKPFDTPPQSFDPEPLVPHPLIAHFIHSIEDISKIPAFVALGIPLFTIEEVEKWARSIADILQKAPRSVSLNEAKRIQDQRGIQGIYERNTRLFL